MHNKPKISIITPSKNTGRFAKETIESILAQTYTAWEHIVIDGVSLDETLEVIEQYPHIRLISEKDSGPDEAFRKGLTLAKGEYVMFCAFSDGYLDNNWFKKCIDILDNFSEISLVWGLPQFMYEDSSLGPVAYDYFFNNLPPQSKIFIYYWLKTHFHFPEGNFCIRKNVMNNCFPIVNPQTVGKECEFLTFNYKFNTLGYLPYFIPAVANYGRIHQDSGGRRQMVSGQMLSWIERYHCDIEKYTKLLLRNKIIHSFKDGNSKVLPDEFNISNYKNIKLNCPLYKKNMSLRIMKLLTGNSPQ